MTQPVHELMRRGLITCRPDATLGQVAVMLTQHRIHALYIEDNQKRVLGVITDFDLLAGEWLAADETSLKAMRAMSPQRAARLRRRPLNRASAESSTGTTRCIRPTERTSPAPPRTAAWSSCPNTRMKRKR